MEQAASQIQDSRDLSLPLVIQVSWVRDYCCAHSLDRMTSLFESMTSKSVPFCPLLSSSLKRKNAAGTGWAMPRAGLRPDLGWVHRTAGFVSFDTQSCRIMAPAPMMRYAMF